jgi:two-component system, OmpR family, sensor kinase
MSRLRRASLQRRLLLLFLLITAIAIGIVYLYVVPQLESSLVAEKLKRLEDVASSHEVELTGALRRRASPRELNLIIDRVAQSSDSRVTVLAVGRRAEEQAPSFVVSDSESDATATESSFEIASAAIRGERPASGTSSLAGQRVGEAALPLTEDTDSKPAWVAVFSTPLSDVGDNVGLIQRQILIAGAIALAAALLAGYYAAQAISRRLRRLEKAAQEVASGRFGVTIPVDSADELGQLAKTFNEMQQRLARLDDARKEFIANASHELRTPIFSLAGFVELLQDEELDEATREDFLRTMGEQLERLTNLTTDLLDLSKLDAGALEVRPAELDVTDVASSIISEFGVAARRHRSALEVRTVGGDRAKAFADKDRVAQILRILLDNALTHTPEGTPITVTVLSQNGLAEVVVSDEGPGIDRRLQAQIFERFHTGAPGRGSGLGLAVARELALRMHGRLDVASKAGFTAFTLELPSEPLATSRQG